MKAKIIKQRGGEVNKDDVLWTAFDDAEILQSSIDLAVDEFICEHDIELDEIPDEIILYKYTRETVSMNIDTDCALEPVLERLSDIYGSPDDPCEATLEMEKEAKIFIDKIKSLYVPWTCKKIGEQKFDIRGYK